MAAPIVAKSLSTLTDLANKPPSRKWEVKLDALVLYIARVPGSKDVFLTPLKPRDRVVTAEDVESCLYYIHVSSVEDEAIVSGTYSPASEHHGIQPQVSDRPRVNVHNPPLTTRAGLLQPDHQLPELSPHPAETRLPYPLEDGPPKQGYYPLRERTHMPNQVPRKPAPAVVLRKPIAPISTPQVPVRISQTQHNLSRSSRTSLCPSPPDHKPQFTVIRRNPSTREQWNVGSVADPPVFEVASGERRPSTPSTRCRKSGQPLYLCITNPGYAKFLSTNSGSSGHFPDGLSTQDHEACFKRRMWLEGSHFQRKHPGHDSSLSVDQAPPAHLLSPQSSQASFSSRRPSCDSEGFSSYNTESYDIETSRRSQDDAHRLSADWTFGVRGSQSLDEPRYPEMRRLSLQSEKRSSTRGYTFLNPWGERCEFAAGISGNSLKCKVLPRTNVSNGPATAQDSLPTQISELRFNLPLLAPLTSDPPAMARRDRDGKKQSRGSRFLARLQDRSQDRLADDHTTHALPNAHGRDHDIGSRLDLSLGQELAGGGFAGRQAKLGKLIIEGEGLLMMDLLVSANMALWFRAWDKTTRE